MSRRPVLHGDGVHDDTDALQALVDGKPFDVATRLDPIAEAVAAERRRAAEAVREIVRHYEETSARNQDKGRTHIAGLCGYAAAAARDCLAAVEGKR